MNRKMCNLGVRMLKIFAFTNIVFVMLCFIATIVLHYIWIQSADTDCAILHVWAILPSIWYLFWYSLWRWIPGHYSCDDATCPHTATAWLSAIRKMRIKYPSCRCRVRVDNREICREIEPRALGSFNHCNCSKCQMTRLSRDWILRGWCGDGALPQLCWPQGHKLCCKLDTDIKINMETAVWTPKFHSNK